MGQSVRRGDLAGFDEALANGENEFVRRRIYLTLERGRDIALRNLLRKVYLVGGFEEPKDAAPPLRRTRVPVAEFGAALRLGNKTLDRRLENDEIECLLANMIYKVRAPLHLITMPEANSPRSSCGNGKTDGLVMPSESNKGLHIARTGNCGTEQGWRSLSWNRCLTNVIVCLH